MKAWLLAARPKTLLAGIVPVWLGSVLAWFFATDKGRFQLPEGHDDPTWGMAFLVLGSCLCIQIATNLFNDVIDFRKGADTEKRMGGKRVTQSGLLSPRAVWAGAITLLVLAAILAAPIIQLRGWPIIAIGIPSMYFAFGYTGGPLPLAYRGLGELFVILFFGIVACVGTFFAQTGIWSMQPVVLGLQVGMLSTVLIAVNNLRDIEEDSQSGKRTLAVRFGKTFARWEIAVLSILPILMGTHWMHHSEKAVFFPMIVIGLGLLISAKVFTTEPGPAYNKYLGMASAQMLAFGLMFTLALVT